jgi:hypothetical protein
MADQERPSDTEKKPYTKPEMTRVTLRPEEAVLGACKNNRVSGAGQPTCRFPSACSSIAS